MSEKNNPEILIIDDETQWAEAILLYLRRKYEFIIVDNSTEGLKLLKENTVDVVIIDYRLLEEKNGVQIINEIRKFNKFIPIIFVSGKIANKEPIINAIEEGISFYVDKNDSNLSHKMELALEKSLKSRDTVIVAIENWLNEFEDKEEIIITSIVGEDYSIEQILKEIKKDSEIGKTMYEGIIKITMRLLKQDE